MSRPLKPISEKQVIELAKIGCTNAEIAAVVGCHVDTLHDRFSAVIKKGKEEMKSSLRRFQYNSAKKGSVPMQIWLGKQYLDQRDKNEQTGAGGGPIQVEDVNKTKVFESARKLAEKHGVTEQQAIDAMLRANPELAKWVQ